MSTDSAIDFTKLVKNISVRYVSSHIPTERDLDDWIVLPLYQHGQDMPIDNDGRTSLLLANAPTLYRLLMNWEQKTNKIYRKQNEIESFEKTKRDEMRKRQGELKSTGNIKEVKTSEMLNCLVKTLNKCMDGLSDETSTTECRRISQPLVLSSETVYTTEVRCNSQQEEMNEAEYMSNSTTSSFCMNHLDGILENATNIDKKEDNAQQQWSNHFSNVLNSEAEHAAANLEKELNGLPQEWRQFSKVDIFIKKQVESIKSTSAAACEDDFVSTFCYTCRKDLLTSKALYMHNLKCHTDGELHCDICGKHLKNRITLMKHKKLHLAPEELLYACNNCGKRFKDKRALTAHITYTRHITTYS